MSYHRTRINLLLLAVLILTFAIHLLVIAEPFGRDQGIFAYIGQALLRGDVPYRDAWDHKTPGIYGVYALAFALFGRSMASVHLLEGIILTIAAFVIYQTGRKLRGDAVGLLGALLYGLSATLLFEWWDRGQVEIYMGLTGALAVYALLAAFSRTAPLPLPSRGEHGSVAQELPAARPAAARGMAGQGALIFVSGVFCGLTLYFKPTGLPLLAAVWLLAVLFYSVRGLRSALAASLSFVAGIAVSFIPLLGYFAANGALNELYQTIIVFNSYHVRIGGSPTLAGNVMGTLDFLAAMNILSPLAMVGLLALAGVAAARVRAAAQQGGAPLAARSGRLRGVMAALPDLTVLAVLPVWLIASAAGIWTQGKFFSYHWSAVLTPLCLLAAWGVLSIGREVGRNKDRTARLLAVSVCLAVLAVYGQALARDHAPKWTRDASYLLQRTSEPAYLAGFGHNIQGRDIYSFSQTRQTALYLQAHTHSDDTVLVWGFQSLVNFLARPETAFRVQARRTFLNDLTVSPPSYIVVVTNDVNPIQAVDSAGLLAGFPEFQRILQQFYRLETDIGEFHVYRRIDA